MPTHNACPFYRAQDARGYCARSLVASMCLMLAFMLSSCVKVESAQNLHVIAKVNGQPLWYRDYEQRLTQIQANLSDPGASRDLASQPDALKRRALNEAIIAEIVRQQAQRQKIHVAPAEIDAVLQSWKDTYPPGGFAKMLTLRHTREGELKNHIEEQLLIEKVAGQLFGAEMLVSDDEMKAYYQSHEREFYQKAKVHTLQILVSTLEEARRIRADILSGKLTFESAARQYSLGSEAARGGDLGTFSQGERSELLDKTFALTTNTISDPMTSPFGYHLFKVVEKTQGKKLSFAEAKNHVIASLRNAKEKRVYSEWITKMLKDAVVYKEASLRLDP